MATQHELYIPRIDPDNRPAILTVVPEPEFVKPTEPARDLRADGSLYLHWALSKHRLSLTTQAASIALSFKRARYDAKKIKKEELSRYVDSERVVAWTNNVVGRDFHVTRESVEASARRIFPFATRLLDLKERDLELIVGQYPKIADKSNLFSEADLRHQADLLMLQRTKDRALGYALKKPRQSIVVYLADRTQRARA